MMKMRQTLNMHNFISVQDIDKIFSCRPMVGSSGSANSNMQSKNTREPRELPWQQNFGKKTKLHRFQFWARNQGLFPMNSKVFGDSEFKYII